MEVKPGARERTASVRTFLIADVRGYTAFTRARGDVEAARLAKRFADLAREAVEARRGRVIELRGDEALAVFESAAQAVRAAVDFQATCLEETARDPAVPLTVGIGIDIGEAVPVEDGYRGVALNTAARLCSKAVAGQVLVTRAIAEQAGELEDVRFEERGDAELKGFDQPVALIEAVPSMVSAAEVPPEGTGPRRESLIPPELDPLTPLVDRDREMQWLRGTWRQARRGRGRILIVSGPSQIGKTRLASELAGEVARAGDAVRYAGPGGTAAALAIAAVREATTTSVPMFVVLDDLDIAGPDAARAVAEGLPDIATNAVLVLLLVKDHAGDPELSTLLETVDRFGDGHVELSPLSAEGVQGIAELYVGSEIEHVPLESMARASGGVPGRVHEVVSEWARDEAGRRLAAAAQWLSEGQGRRSADLDFANNVIGLKLGRLYAAEGQMTPKDVCPYKGLASFDDTDSALFFGRERLVGELAARTVQVGLLGVMGASGSGKSSAVAAGLLPSLRAGLLPGSERWRQVVFRPGEHPMAELESVLGSFTQAELQGRALDRVIATSDAEQRVVIAIDQFEEVFTLCHDEAERGAFLDAITTAATGSSDRVMFVLTLRDDFYGHCAPYRALAELLSANHVLVPPMSADELRRAIELPARRAGLRVEGALLESLVDEVAEEPGGLPLLSAALVELWHLREDGWLRNEAYERTGGVRGAVARLAEASFQQLEQREREIARRIFLRLAAVGDGEMVTRRRVHLSELDLEGDRSTADVLDRMTRDRLLTASDTTVEVAHEALLREWPRLRGWLEEDLQGRQLWQHLTQSAKQWEAARRDPSELYRGARLSAAVDWSSAHGRDLNVLERDFLAESRQASDREADRQRRTNRRLRGLLVGTGIFLVVALVAGALALVQRGRARGEALRAETQARLATARELAAAAVANLDVDPELSILLAAEAVDSTWKRDRSVMPEAEEALHQALQRSRVVLSIPQGGALAATDDGRRFATGAADGTTTIWSTDGGRQLLNLRGHKGSVTGLAFDPRGERLVTTGADESIRIWDARTGREMGGLLGNDGPASAPAFAPDGRLLATAGSDATIRLWDVDQGRTERVLRGPDGLAFDVALAGARPVFSPDGRYLASGGWGNTAVIWDVRTGKISRTLPNHRWEVTDLTFSPDGERLTTVNFEGVARTWDLASNRDLTTFSGHTGETLTVDSTHDGGRIATGGSDGTARVWEAGSGKLLMTLAGHSNSVTKVAFLSGDEGRLATTSLDGTTRLWDIGPGGGRDWLKVPGPYLRIGGVAFSPDGKTFAVPEQDTGVVVYDVETGSITQRLSGHGGTVTSVRFSPDGSKVVGASSSGATNYPQSKTVPIWNPRNGELVGTLAGHQEEISGVAFSPDGRRIVTGSYDGTLRVWNVDTREEQRALEVGADAWGITFSPDGSSLFAGIGCEGPVTAWDARTFEKRATLEGHTDCIQVLTFDQDGRLVSAAADGTARVWDVRTNREVSTLSGHSGAVLGVSVSPDGSRIATSSIDGTAKLWDADTGREILTLFGHEKIVHTVTFSPDGRFLATASGDGTVALHIMEIEELRKVARQRVTRALTDEECQRYLHRQRCAAAPAV